MTRGGNDELEGLIRTRIHQELARLRIGNAELARMTGVSPSMISMLLSGERTLTVKYIDLIAKALDVPVATLFEEVREGPSLAELRRSIGVTSTQWMNWIDRIAAEPPAKPAPNQRLRVISVDSETLERLKRSGRLIGDVAAGTPTQPQLIVPDEWQGEWWTREFGDERGEEKEGA